MSVALMLYAAYLFEGVMVYVCVCGYICKFMSMHRYVAGHHLAPVQNIAKSLITDLNKALLCMWYICTLIINQGNSQCDNPQFYGDCHIY